MDIERGLPPVTVLVPMLGRAHRVQPLLESLGGEYPVLFLCSPEDTDTIRECERSGQDTLVVDWEPDRGDYARKLNLGYRETITPWVFCGASDLTFHEGWARHAIMVGDNSRAGVVGTQDGANPLVKRAQQSTHSLVRRAYIQEFGSGTFDNSGDIYCELYDHQYIDIELVETAKMRGRWAFSKRSFVDHAHPHWGTAESDSTYVKATRATMDDRNLYVKRMRRHQTVHARALRYNRVRG